MPPPNWLRSGEYAVTSGYGTYGNLSAALGEAAFMTGMERNSDIVQLASYAPLFANVNGIQWLPDLIYYDSSRGMFGTPSYYVQRSEERRVGKEGRSRWSPYHSEKQASARVLVELERLEALAQSCRRKRGR